MKNDLSFRRLLIPLDGSESSLKAVRFALRLARRESATVIGIHAIDEENAADLARYTDCPIAEIVARMERSGAGYLNTARELASRQGISFSAEIRVGIPHRVLLKAATETDADLIIMGTVGRRGPRRVLIGSVTERVIAHSPIPVLVIK